MNYDGKVVAASALWAASAVTLLAATVGGLDLRWMIWGVYVAVAACVLTVWSIVDGTCRRERLRVEHLAEIMAHEAHPRVDRIH